MQLIKDEVVVREFEYAKVNRGGKDVSCSVTITNKRVFTTDATKRQIAHTEVPISKVKRMDATYKAPNNWLSIWFIIYAAFAFILTLVGVFGGLFDDDPRMIWLFVIVIISLILPAWLFWQYPTFTWTLSTVGQEGIPLYTSIAKNIPSKGRIGKIRIHINKKACQEFTYSIGAALAEARMIAEEDGKKAK